MEKKTKLWLGAGLVAAAGYLLWKSKKANTTPAVASTAKPAVATTATGTSNLVGFNSGDFYTSPVLKNASADSIQVPASNQFYHTGDGKWVGIDAKWAKASGGMINSTDVKGAKVGSRNAGIFANQPFKAQPHEVVSKKVMPFTDTDGPVMKHYVGSSVSARSKNLTAGVQSDSEKFNASGNKFFDPKTAKYGQNQGVFAPAPKTTVMPKEVKQAAPTKMIVGVDASNKTSMNFLANQKIWA